MASVSPLLNKTTVYLVSYQEQSSMGESVEHGNLAIFSSRDLAQEYIDTNDENQEINKEDYEIKEFTINPEYEKKNVSNNVSNNVLTKAARGGAKKKMNHSTKTVEQLRKMMKKKGLPVTKNGKYLTKKQLVSKLSKK